MRNAPPPPPRPSSMNKDKTMETIPRHDWGDTPTYPTNTVKKSTIEFKPPWTDLGHGISIDTHTGAIYIEYSRVESVDVYYKGASGRSIMDVSIYSTNVVRVEDAAITQQGMRYIYDLILKNKGKKLR